LEHLYLQHAYLYEADCFFETQEYAQALKLYEQAAGYLRDSPRGLAAYVQMINCYVFMGEPREARAALARALVAVNTMPDSAFQERVAPQTGRVEKVLRVVGRIGPVLAHARDRIMAGGTATVAADGAEEVLGLLRQQAALYERLENFAQRQRFLVAEDDPSPLIALLADRQRLSAELAASPDGLREPAGIGLRSAAACRPSR